MLLYIRRYFSTEPRILKNDSKQIKIVVTKRKTTSSPSIYPSLRSILGVFQINQLSVVRFPEYDL